MKEFIDQLVALLQSGALDEESLVVVPAVDRAFVEVPQSFFRDKELIAAVQAAKNPEISLHDAASRIHAAVFNASEDFYQSAFERLRDEVLARQVDAYLDAHNRVTDPRRSEEAKWQAEQLGLPLELPDPEQFLSHQVIQDLADQKVVNFFYVRKVTGPAVVTSDCGSDGHPYWCVKSLREELVQLKQLMESK